MALKPVQDPNLLAALDAPAAPATPGPRPVTDPALLAQLEAPKTPQEQLYEAREAVPTPDNMARVKQLESAQPAPPAAEEPGLFTRAMNAARGDPVIDMWLSSLGTAVKGAPEVAMDTIGNMGVMGVAGLTAPLVSESPDDAANFVQDFTEQNLMRPQGESAKQLTAALGDAFAPVENIKRGLGEKTLELTGSPDLAATMDMAPDFLSTVLGVPGVTKAANKLPKTPLKADPAPVNPTIENLRAADIRLRPSDVRAMEPGAKKVPGEFRERFADAPDLKKDLTLHNQTRLTDLAAEELGVKTLDEASLNKAREAPAATYDMVENVLRDRAVSKEFADTFRTAAASAKLAKGEAYSVTRILSALRRRAAKRMQSDNVQTEEAGFADRDLADRLEEALSKELEAAGEPQLFQQFRDARQQFAKIHDVETATVANQLDANILKKLRNKGVPLSGRLALAADAAEFAPNVTQHSLKTAARAGGEIENSKEGLLKSLLKSGIRKIPGMDVGSARFQDVLGRVDPTAVANFGRKSDLPGPRVPEQPELDLRDILELDTPGAVGPRPQRAPDVNEQADIFGGAFDLQPPKGRAGIDRPTTARSIDQVMVDGEPLAEPAVNFRAQSLADILGLSEPLARGPRTPRAPSGVMRPRAERTVDMQDLGTVFTPDSDVLGPRAPQTGGGATIRETDDVAEAASSKMPAANEPDMASAARTPTQTKAYALLDAIQRPGAKDPAKAVKQAADALSLQAAELPRPVRLALQSVREIMADTKAAPGELLDAYDELSTMLRQYVGE